MSQNEIATIPSQKNKRRIYGVSEQSLMESVNSIIDQHQRRSLVICNTVARAQEMYRRLNETLQRSNTDVFLLHSRFLKADREQKENALRKRFSHQAANENVILVATQVIEVGLDVTCETLHTEVAPASAVFQRAGRCARFKDESGTVIVYAAPPTESGNPNYHPYTELGSICENTFNAFQARKNCVLDFHAEQEVINEVHGKSDEEMLDRLHSLPTHSRISECICGIRYEMAQELIRKNDSITILFTQDDPEVILDPFQTEGFSLYRGTLYGQWNLLHSQAQQLGLDWILKYPVEEETPETASGNSRAVPRYEWQAMTVADESPKIFPVLAIHPRLAAYDSSIGFRFEADGVSQFHSIATNPNLHTPFISRFSRETYTQHIQHLMAAYQQSLRDELNYAAAHLETKLELPPGTLDRAIRLSIALHDVGKLTTAWQQWAHDWQACVEQPVDENYMVAHTDYDGTNAVHREKEKQMKTPRPPHAVESVPVVAQILVETFGTNNRSLIAALLTAIARHHSPTAARCQSFSSLHPQAAQELGCALKIADPETIPYLDKLQHNPSCVSLLNLWIQPDNTLSLLAYFLIVRALRLADQWATEQASQGGIN